jgi:PAS domain S-box-containing protein
MNERQDMEEKLKFLEFSIDSICEAIHWLTMEFRFWNVNAAACRMLGYSREELLSLSLFDIDPDYANEDILSDSEKMKRTGTLRSRRFHRAKDGRSIPVEITSNYFTYDNCAYICCIVRDITDRREPEEELRESESAVRRKLESILDPEGEIGELDLADILDAQGIQALMEDLYRLAGIKMSIIDLKGRVLVDVGWQDICLEFHRAHPETRMNCLVSDTGLSVGVPSGEFRQYRCLNNMWHLVTPIIVGGRHMGNLFMGQFFFEKEELDYDLFRSQARRYGFPEEEYIAALEAVPRHSEECVDMGKAVFLRLTDMFSKLSYANIKLARTLAEREQLTATLREANLVVENSPVVLFRWKADEGWPVELVSGNVIQFGYKPEDFLSGAMTYSSIIHPDDLERVACQVRDYCAEGVDQFRLDYRIITKGGNIRWVNEHTKVERNPEGCPTHFQGIVIDVTGRKEIEEALWEAHEELESRVRERTGQLTSLTAELSLAEERERRRIATELHDQVGQTLILSKLKLNSLTQAHSSSEFGALLGEISRHIGHSIEDIRSLTFQLSPPLLYEVGFEAAVEWLADELAERHGFRVDFRDDGEKKPLNEETRVALYQMVRELIINVVKHADAKRVDISIGRFADRIRVIVSDDGSGFDSEAIQRRLIGNRSFGLFNIRHRTEYLGGEFAIESEIGRGTRITLLLPVTENGVESRTEEN